MLLRSLQLGDASQVLSIFMTDKFALNQLRHWISDLPQYRFNEARRHCLVYGRGHQCLVTVPTLRLRLSTAQIDHFIAFITGPILLSKFCLLAKEQSCYQRGRPLRFQTSYGANNHPVYDLQPRICVMFKSLRGIAKLFPSWTPLQKSHLLTTCYQQVGRSSQVLVDVDFHSL